MFALLYYKGGREYNNVCPNVLTILELEQTEDYMLADKDSFTRTTDSHLEPIEPLNICTITHVLRHRLDRDTE